MHGLEQQPYGVQVVEWVGLVPSSFQFFSCLGSVFAEEVGGFVAIINFIVQDKIYDEGSLSLGIDIELMDRPVLAIRQPNLVDADKTRLRCREQDVGDG